MRRVEWKDSTVSGDIAYRILKNYCRLESGIYRFDKIFTMDKNGWPGDWEGRTILALVTHAQVTKREPAYLNDIMKKLPQYFNKRGYMGPVREDGEADEQQLSGHNWLLRGLMAYAEWKHDSAVWNMAEHMVNTLFKPTSGLYASYPVRKRRTGRAAGNLKGKEGAWYLSTDTGCAFICMDALAEYYEKTRDEEVAGLLGEMLQKFSKIDILGTAMQTHAALSALRGILRFYEATGKTEYLEYAESVFHLYHKHGMTANYANQNWFGKPLWTEPCAIVDSYMAAMKLFQYTDKAAYLELAHKIYYNALCFAQRYNGGFGCDVCTGEGKEILQVQKSIFEAYWCCTMRGAEGLKEMASDTVWISKDSILILNQNNIQTKIDGMALELKTSYPKKGEFSLSAEGGSSCVIKIYIPKFGQRSLKCTDEEGNHPVKLSGDFLELRYNGKSLKVKVEFKIPVMREEKYWGKQRYVRFWRGEQILGKMLSGKMLHGKMLSGKTIGYVAENPGAVTLDQMIDMENKAESENVKIQIMFPRRGKA